MEFRKDINGLRAFAVLFVLIFHFFPSLLPGGFIGVDVFFVISGYLMTSIVLRGLQENNFSIITFYFSRARRILPALLVLCVCLFVFGYFFLSPSEYKDLGKHALGSMGFFSNVLYWKELGYFDLAAKNKWLLHTWSLSVEWQFYFLYPIFLSALYKIFGLEKLKYTFIVILLLLFIVSIYWSYQYADFSYFWFPARAWEMMAGGAICIYSSYLLKFSNRWFEVLGILLLVAGVFYLSEKDPWPGLLGLLPVLGTCFIIMGPSSHSIWLTNRVSQSLGYASYSIYLWHWPVVVFLYKLEKYDVTSLLLGSVAAIFLGYLSYFLIERKSTSISLYKYWKNSVVMVLTFLLMGLSFTIFYTQGIENRSHLAWMSNAKRSPLRETCHFYAGNYPSYKESCEYFGRRIEWAIFGDSHLVELGFSMAQQLEHKGVGVKHLTLSNCLPAYGLTSQSRQGCINWLDQSLSSLVDDDGIRNVIVGYRYSTHFFGANESSYPFLPDLPPIIDGDENNNEKRDLLWQSFYKMIDTLSQYKEKVFIIMPIPEIGRSIHSKVFASTVLGNKTNNIAGTSIDYYNDRNQYVLHKFNEQRFPENVVLIDPKSLFCDNKSCYAVKNRTPLYFDSNHISPAGARLLVDEILNPSH